MINVSFQLYSARNYQPFTDVIGMLAGLGYKQIEGFGPVFDDVPAIKSAMDKHAVTMPSAHFVVQSLQAEKAKVLATARALNVQILVAPHLLPDERPNDKAGWIAFGTVLEGLAQDYAKDGFSLAWHNHDFEFCALPDGSIPQDLIFEAAPTLKWEIDIAWIVKGKADPLAWIRKYGNRIAVVHLKDIAPAGQCADEDGWADLGHGVIDWAPVMAALKTTPAAIYAVEHDNPNDLNRFASRSLAAVRSF